jgi:hydrogenase maturation factor HypF (carbamoyltransferase family)
MRLQDTMTNITQKYNVLHHHGHLIAMSYEKLCHRASL